MDPEIILVIARSLERVVIVLVSGMSIWCGYKLFSIVTEADSRGMLESKGLKFRFSRVGPGVFFALFGSLVLSFSVAQKLEFPTKPAKEKGSAQQGDTIAGGKYYIDNHGELSLLENAIGSLNGLKYLASLDSFSHYELDKLREYSTALQPLRALIVDSKFGAGSFSKFRSIELICESNLGSCDALLASSKDNELYERIEEFLSKNLK